MQDHISHPLARGGSILIRGNNVGGEGEKRHSTAPNNQAEIRCERRRKSGRIVAGRATKERRRILVGRKTPPRKRSRGKETSLDPSRCLSAASHDLLEEEGIDN